MGDAAFGRTSTVVYGLALMWKEMALMWNELVVIWIEMVLIWE